MGEDGRGGDGNTWRDGGYGIGAAEPSEPTVEEQLAGIAREDYEEFQSVFFPALQQVEEDVFSESAARERIEGAAERVGDGQRVAREAQGRSMERYGVTRTPEQVKAAERLSKFGAASAGVAARNSVRRAVSGERLDVLRSIDQLGVGMKRAATGAMGTAAAGAASVANNNAAASAQHNQQMVSTAISLALLI